MKRINQVMVVLALFSVLMSAYATEEGDIASCFIHLPAGYEGIDGTWIGGNTEYAFLLLGCKEENALRLAVVNQVEERQYKIIELSKPILSYDEFVSGAHWMQDPWDESKPYFWWGASDVQTNVDIYLCIEQKNDQEWYVAYGFIADQGGNIKYSFSLEDDKSITITQDTVYPSIRWKTDVSFRLDDFDIAAVEAVCMDAIAFLEKLREHPCFMEYRIEE